MKKVLTFVLAAMLMISTANAVDLYVNSEKIETDTPPTIVDGRTLVPLRAIFKAIGAEVEWDGDTRTATGKKGDTTVSLQIGNTTAYVNGEARTLNVPAQLINGRTMVPVRFISESLDCNVIWDAATSSVRVFSELYDVVRVIDGDTIVVNYNGKEETVRLIGVDTPESVHPTASKNTEAGFAASRFTHVYLNGKKVSLELDVQERDQYGRLLAYVYVDGMMFNEKLLQAGYASVATYPPNIKYVDRFTEIEANRDPSIPSGKYLDGYMEAPEIIYRKKAEKTGLQYALLYTTGKVDFYGKDEDGTDYYAIKNNNEYMIVVNMFDAPDFYTAKVGDTVSVGVIYTTTDVDNNMAGGVYIETLTASTSQTTPTTPINPITPTNPGTTNPSAESRTVYVTKTGKKYHYDNHCNGGIYYASTMSEAKSRGLTACEKCVK